MNKQYITKDVIYKFSVYFILFLGVLIRLFFFVQGRPFWHDECSTVLNIFEKSYFELWGVLSNLQSAPPIYLMISKFFNSIPILSPHYTLRLFPFCCGVASVFAFYILTKKVLNKRLPVIISNILFALNVQLIYYSQEFRQYSSDVLICILCILHFSRLCTDNLNVKSIILNSIILLILPFISLPSVFIIGAWVILSLFGVNKTSIKNLIYIILPTFIANIFFYIYTLSPTHKILTGIFPNLDGFLSLNYSSIVHTIKFNYLYFFSPSNLIILPVILSILGIIIFIKRKEPTDKLILLSIILILAASFAHLYPIRERNALYILPIILILITTPLSYIKNKAANICVLLMIAVFAAPYFNHYINIRNMLQTYKIIESPDLFMKIIKENYNKDDIIIYNDASYAEFKVYANLYNFKIYNAAIGQINAQKDYKEQDYTDLLNKLPKSQTYWFYCPFDYSQSSFVPYLKQWAHSNGEILYEKQINHSYLLLLKL